jgi:aminoglycoside phosphotransferase (APT) family kinase protein
MYPNRGPPLTTIAQAPSPESPPASTQPDDELLRMFAAPLSETAQLGSSPFAAAWAGTSVPDTISTTPPVTPVKIQRVPLSWSGSGGSSDCEVALWADIVHAMSPTTEQRVMHERMAEVPRAARRLIPNWRDTCLPDVQPLVGASACAFKLRNPTDGAEYFVRLLRSSASRDARLVSVTRAAAAAGVGPAVVGADGGAMVQRWCEGVAPDSLQYREPQHARRLGAFLSSMHNVPDPPETSETRQILADAAMALTAVRREPPQQRPAPVTAQTVLGCLSLAFEPSVAASAAKPPLSLSPPSGSPDTELLWAMPRLSVSPERKSSNAIPHAAHGPLYRNGVDMDEFQATWEASKQLQAAALQPELGRSAALVWSHGDLHLQNLLEIHDGSGSRTLQVIDLETVAKRPAATDLANLFRFWRFPPLGTRRALVEGYLSHHPCGGAGPQCHGDAAVDKADIDAMLWGIECCMPVCTTRWILMVMTAPDAMGGDPSATRVRQAAQFLPLLDRAVAVLREASGRSDSARARWKEVIDRGIWAVAGLPPLDEVFVG